jgi:anti-anti-sigma regulatory factor
MEPHPQPADATIALTSHQAGHIVVLEGEHDLATLPALESALRQVAGGRGSVVVDLSACTYVDCATVGTITGSSASPLAIFVADTAAPIVRRLLEILDVAPIRVRRPDHAEMNGHPGSGHPFTALLRAVFDGAGFATGSLYVITAASRAGEPPGRQATASARSAQPDRDDGEEPGSTSPAALMLRAADARRRSVEYRRAGLAGLAQFERLREECAATCAASAVVTAEYEAKLREYHQARHQFDRTLDRLLALWSEPARAGRRWLQEARGRTAGRVAANLSRQRSAAGGSPTGPAGSRHRRYARP